MKTKEENELLEKIGEIITDPELTADQQDSELEDCRVKYGIDCDGFGEMIEDYWESKQEEAENGDIAIDMNSKPQGRKSTLWNKFCKFCDKLAGNFGDF